MNCELGPAKSFTSRLRVEREHYQNQSTVQDLRKTLLSIVCCFRVEVLVCLPFFPRQAFKFISMLLTIVIRFEKL